MSSSQTTPSRSAAARQAARDHLAALRAARLRRRISTPPNASDMLEDVVGGADSASNITLSPVAGHPIGTVSDPTGGPQETPDDLDPCDSFSPDTDEVFPDETENAISGESFVAPQEPHANAVEGAGSTSLPDTDPDTDIAPDDEAPPQPGNILAIDALAHSPLSVLPGAGPGLVWMLEKAGISTLEDLAQADKAALSDALGLVGEILDLDYWIDWAARKVAK